MADLKISELGAASVVNDTDLFPMTSAGVTVKTTAQQLKNYIGVGNLADLTTDAKTSAVAAISEVDEHADIVRAQVSNGDDVYSASKAYAVGDLCIHNNMLYRCITACSAGSWATNQSCFTADTLVNVVDTINDRDKILTANVTNLFNVTTGAIHFAKRNGIVSMSIDIDVPSDESSDITFDIPPEFLPAEPCFIRWTFDSSNIYCFFYPNNPRCTILHSARMQITHLITYVGKE